MWGLIVCLFYWYENAIFDTFIPKIYLVCLSGLFSSYYFCCFMYICCLVFLLHIILVFIILSKHILSLDFKEFVKCSVSACEVMYLSQDLPWSNGVETTLYECYKCQYYIIPMSCYHCAFGGY